jgi:hypothetical protein
MNYGSIFVDEESFIAPMSMYPKGRVDMDNFLVSECSEDRQTLLSRHWQWVLGCSLLVYMCFQMFMAHNSMYGSNPICRDTYMPPEWVRQINFVVVVAFVLSALSIVFRMIRNGHFVSAETLSSLAANLTIKLIAGSSTTLTLFWRWGGVCRDGLG